MNILIHTWQLSKYKGSEFSVSYNYIKSMMNYHKLYVIFASNSHQREDYSELDELKSDFPNCTFITVKSNLYMNIWKKIEKKVPSYILNIIKYAYYKEWEKLLYKSVKNSDFLKRIDLIHYVGPAGYHEPGYLWKLGKPYIWGPVSGFENINKILAKNLFVGGKKSIILRLKSVMNNFTIKYNKRIKDAIERSDVIIAATNSNKNIILKNYKCKKLVYFPENLMRITSKNILSEEQIKKKYLNVSKLNIIWVGNIEARKMPNLLIDSLRRIKHDNILVTCIGGGEQNILSPVA